MDYILNYDIRDERRSKILYVLKILWEETDEGHPMSAAIMTSRLESYGIGCERRSIFRCFDSLEEFGFDIIRTKKGTYLGNRILELPELKLLVDAVQSSKFITTGKSTKLINSLSELTSIHERDHLKRQVYVSGRVKTMNESVYYNIDTIWEGIENNVQISFMYLNWNADKMMVPRRDGKRYEVSPWCLIWEREQYYLVGFDKSSGFMKHYRVDKMSRIELLDLVREGMEEYKKMNLSTYTTENFGMFQGKQETVNMQAEHDMAGVVIDKFGKDVWMHETEHGMMTVTVDVAVTDQFFGWVTSMGGKVKILSPDWVKEEYVKLLERCMG